MRHMGLVNNKPYARPFKCDWWPCIKGFAQKADLKRHYRIHTNERPYACSFPGCGKSFSQAGTLTAHTRRHTGEKPHQCRHIGCVRRFSDSSSLARHRRIHTPKCPYKCTHGGCSKSFYKKEDTAKHQQRRNQQGMVTDDINTFTFQHPEMNWSPQGIFAITQVAPGGLSHHALSFAEPGFQINSHCMLQHHGNLDISDEYAHAQFINRTTVMPYKQHFVDEQEDLGVATMKVAKPSPFQLSPQLESALLIPTYSTPEITTSIQSGLATPYASFTPGTMFQGEWYFQDIENQLLCTVSESEASAIYHQPQKPVQNIPSTIDAYLISQPRQ